MSTWFWLNTEITPSCWCELDKTVSLFIEDKYEKGIPTQLRPFYLPAKGSHITRQIRLLPNVNIPMAIECSKNYPLICIINKNTNKLFTYNINLDNINNGEEKKSNIDNNGNNNNNNINNELITQKIIFLNQEIKNEKKK
eukprot:224443_1